jgi:hypothetical protein
LTPPASPGGSFNSANSDLMRDIRAGISLKKAPVQEVGKKKRMSGAFATTLFSAMEERRKYIDYVEDHGNDEDYDPSDWE